MAGLRNIFRGLHRLYVPPQVKHRTGKCLYKDEHHMVNSTARILIRSDIFVQIRAADMLDFPDCNVMNCLLYATNSNSPMADMCITVHDNRQNVEIICKKLCENSDSHCELLVPFQSQVNVVSTSSVGVSNLYSEEVKIDAVENIHVHNIRGKQIELFSTTGDIHCSMLVASTILMEAVGNGNINLTKAQGRCLQCKTFGGNIEVGASYALSNKFSTENGRIDLQNIHNKTEIFIYGKGALIITSFNGILDVSSNGGSMVLDLMQIKKESVIIADKSREATVYISEAMEKNIFMKITGRKVNLDDTIAHLCGCLNKERTSFQLSTEEEKETKLFINTKKAEVTLGKRYWPETIRTAII